MANKSVSGFTPLDHSPYGAPRQPPQESTEDAIKRARLARAKRVYRRSPGQIKAAAKRAREIVGEGRDD